jgi:4-methyl-5(b-hydroxyethyl)-thiazole monophosphate biosynthesis
MDARAIISFILPIVSCVIILIYSYYMKKVLIPLAEGFEDIEAVAIIDILRRGGIGVVTASLGDDLMVESAHGIFMRADAKLQDVIADEYTAIILPGGGLGTKNLKECEPLLERLRQQKEEGGLLCAICAAPTVLEAAEVLDEEVVTCYPSCAVEMSRPVQHVPVVADGQIITGQGPGSAVIFSLVVLAHIEDHRRAQIVANGMVAEFK